MGADAAQAHRTAMTKQNIGYWTTTALVALAMLAGGAMDLAAPPELAEGMAHLGYPAYFLLILGAWKIAGGLALLAPRTPLLKEWAYAGIAFDLTGAAASHAFAGDPPGNVVTPLVLFALLVVSWWLRPGERRLSPAPTLASAPSAAPASQPA